LYRAWSDGSVEAKATLISDAGICSGVQFCASPWRTIASPKQGFNAASDINFDSKVDGADLSQVLNDWGNAPRQDIVPSTCPLNLINP